MIDIPNSPIVQTFIAISALAFIPLLVASLTTFSRNIVVLSLLRYALGLQQTPPNVVLITLALFLTLFGMMPTINAVRAHAYAPYVQEQISAEQAVARGFGSIKRFMIAHTERKDFETILEAADAPIPRNAEAVDAVYLIPAFMLSELKTAFQIGFVIFLPFLLVDLVVAAILMSLGMIMVPPTTISLPIKVMLFVLIGGWGLIVQTLLSSVAG